MNFPAWPSATELQTHRLVLEPLRVAHAEQAATAFADQTLHRFTRGHPATADELQQRYARQVVGHSPDGQHGWLNWMLRERRSDQLVGTLQATTHGPGGSSSTAPGMETRAASTRKASLRLLRRETIGSADAAH